MRNGFSIAVGIATRNDATLSFLLRSFLTGIITGCTSKQPGYNLSPAITAYAVHSVNIPAIIGPDFKIISTHIKNGKLLAKAVRGQGSYFAGVNLKTGKLEFIVPDPLNDYVASVFDAVGDTLYAISSNDPSPLCKISWRTWAKDTVPLNFTGAIGPGTVFANRYQMFLMNDVWGVGVLNLQNFHRQVFHNEGRVMSPFFSTMSLPIDSSLIFYLGLRSLKTRYKFMQWLSWIPFGGNTLFLCLIAWRR